MSLIDTSTLSVGVPVVIADNANNLADDLDRFSAWFLQFGQKLTLYDKLFSDFLRTEELSDDLNAWLEAVSTFTGGFNTIDESDSLNNLSDSLLKSLVYKCSKADAHLELKDALRLIDGYQLEALSNLFENRSEFQSTKWITTNVTISADTGETTSPIGDNTADKFEPQAANVLIYQIQNPVVQNTDYIFTIYLKSATGGNVSTELRLFTTGFGLLAQQAITITTSWQQFRLVGNSGGNSQVLASVGGGSTLSTGEDGYAWGAQFIESALADEMSFADAAIISFILGLSITATDTLTLTDAVTKTLTQRGTLSLKSEFDNYIRKYLNDPN